MGITNTRIYLTNLGKYNEGILQGEWVDLPIEEEELKKVFERIGINKEYEEYFIADYESDLNITIGEYENIKELNENIEELENINDFDIDKANAIIEFDGADLSDLISNWEDYYFYSGYNLYDYGKEIIDNCYNIPSNLEDYIDYERFAEDSDVYDAGNGILERY